MGERDCAIDFIKGVLVELMIVYHVMNYFVGAQYPLLKYLDFVTGGFVFITGYLISAFHVEKYKTDSCQMYCRLVFRGGKILLLFTLVNLLINLLFHKNYNNAELGLSRFLENIGPIYIGGYKQLAAFEILLPIAYVLILSPLLLTLSRWRTLLMAAVTGVFVYCSLVPTAPFNFLYLSIGLNGFVFGLFFKVHHVWKVIPPVYKVIPVCLAILYIGVHASVEVGFLFYSLGVIVIVCALYAIGDGRNYNTRWLGTIALCGQYSLVAYLSQILILQIIFRLSQQLDYQQLLPVAAFIATNIFVVAICEMLVWLRRQSVRLDRAYKVFFV